MATAGSVVVRRHGRGARRTIAPALIELSVSASGIRNADIIFTSDPMCRLLVREQGQSEFKEGKNHRTETISNNLNPQFAHKFLVNYLFEEKQELRFELYHMKKKSDDLEQQEFLGAVECTLGKIVSCISIEQPLEDRKKKARGTLKVASERKSPADKEHLTLAFSGKSLDRMDVLGKSDPFLEIAKEMDDGSFTVVWRTEVLKKTLNPSWKEFTLPISLLCNGDYSRNLRFQCFDWDFGKRPDLIGEFFTSLETLKLKPPHGVYQLINPKKKEKKKEKYEHSGLVLVHKMQTIIQHSFMDYIRGGTQLKVAVAIDFTQSNGDPQSPVSLHFNQAGFGLNDYARAIMAIGEVLEDYDSDQMIPAFGFGARIDNSEECCHLFALNDQMWEPDCQGVSGVLNAYYAKLEQVQLYGPTCFAPTISYVAQQAQEKLDGSEYHILLILTDGDVDDMLETKKTIVQASELPLSIIIIGIGNEDFQAMEILDGDREALTFKGKQCARDIVQFVKLTDHKDDKALVRDVLAEIPQQFLEYCRSAEIDPQKPRHESTLV